MNKEAYVSFETAKLIKDKGFNWEVFHFYDEDGHLKHREGDCYSLYNWNYPTKDEYGSQYCSAPTQQMACNWLYEEKGIYIAALPCEKGFHAMIYHTVFTPYLEFLGVINDKEHDNPTPQQAIEAALEYVLNNLI